MDEMTHYHCETGVEVKQIESYEDFTVLLNEYGEVFSLDWEQFERRFIRISCQEKQP